MLPLVFTLLACNGVTQAQPRLQLDGPARVRVDHLGPVQGPRVVLDDGSAPDGLSWSAADEAVATVDEGAIVAEAPGETVITGSWGGQKVTWTLVVDPAMVLRISGLPAVLGVGDMLQMRATGTLGDASVDPGTVAWSTSDADVLAVTSDGSATALGPGRAWITARSRGGATSMVEIDVH